MNALVIRKLISTLLFTFIIFKTISLPKVSRYQSTQTEEKPSITFIKEKSNSTPILVQKQQLDYELSIYPNLNPTCSNFIKFEIRIEPLFILIVLIIDRRKRIIGLLTSYFEGNKYKDLHPLYLN